MEVEYDVTLPEVISQMSFGELKTELTVRIKNAEALAVLSGGKVWWTIEDNKFVIDYEPEGYNLSIAIKDALLKRVIEVVQEKATKNIVVDATEIVKRALEYEKNWEKEVKHGDN